MTTVSENMERSFRDHFLGGETITPIESKTKNKYFKVIEWTAPSFIFVAIICHSFDGFMYPLGPLLHLTGASLWVYVGVKNKAGPILLNFVPQIPIWASGLIYWFVGR
jgi:hypothetical protein